MKKNVWFAALLMVIAGTFSALQAADDANAQFVGTWKGTWEGGGAGGSLVLTIGVETGDVSVGQDAGDYVSKFTAVSTTGNRFTARYPYTPDPQADIILTGTFEGNSASGDWNMVPKGEDASFATGTWTVTRQ